MGNWTYGFDTLNRLTAAQNTLTYVPSAQFAGAYGCWSYDAFGNRTAQAAQTTACPSVPSPPFPTASYNSNKQVTWVQNTAPMGYAYDAAGDVTSDNTNTYLYDAEGRICAVRSEPVPGTWTMTGYLYIGVPVDRSSSTGRDADGTRVAKGTITNWSCDPATSGFSTTNDFILGPGGEQVTEMTMNGSGSTLVWEHTNVWAGGKIIATYSQDNTGSQTQASLLHFYFDDPLGSRRVQTDFAGVVEKTCQSLPFGDGETCLATPTEHLYTGKERDQESGNDYFGARYYSSAMGRFMSPDWAAKEEPVPYANMDDPQSLNLYAYVQNNPLNTVDPQGHQGCKDTPELCRAVRDAVSAGHSIQEGWAKRLDDIGNDLSKGVKSAKKGLDAFNSVLGFGKTNCAGGGSCDDALMKAAGAVATAVASDGESEEPEAASLMERWAARSFPSGEASAADHFLEHGAEVGAKDLLQYLRKADAFASRLQNSQVIDRLGQDGTIKYIKGGKYIIKTIEGKIVSFGLVRD